MSSSIRRADNLELINYLFFYFRASLELVIFVIPVIVPMSSSIYVVPTSWN